jgi:anhydro-N-acetylmuramic acid kinase
MRHRSKLQRMRVVGLMSGTSADAVDAALVEWPESEEARPFELIAYQEFPHSEGLQGEIHRLAAGEIRADGILREQLRLDRVLGDAFADAVEGLLAGAGVPADSVDGIASHGQTIAHHPELGGTLQIGCPARLAERTGRPVIADFRRRDIAMNGEGAPLAPFFHHAVFADREETRGVLNLGGIANLTWLPAGGRTSEVVAFDVGPANSLLDSVMSFATHGQERFDRSGARASRGEPVAGWLEELLADPYLARRPPKSTGREHYGAAEARSWLDRSQRENVSLEDLLATLTAFSVRTIADAWRDQSQTSPIGHSARLYVGGGGVRNRFLMESISQALKGVTVEPMDAGGVPADAAEAMAFSLMGRNALLGLPNQLPQCTGVPQARVLGVLHGAEWR